MNKPDEAEPVGVGPELVQFPPTDNLREVVTPEVGATALLPNEQKPPHANEVILEAFTNEAAEHSRNLVVDYGAVRQPLSLSRNERARHRRMLRRDNQRAGHKVDRTSPDSSIGLYLKSIGQYPLLNKDEERELSRAIEVGREAKNKLDDASRALNESEANQLELNVLEGEIARKKFINSNLKLVVSISKKYTAGSGSLDFLDLIQEGNIGLQRAVDKFDWRKGFKFSTYATWWIRQAITRSMLSKDDPIALSTRASGFLNTVEKVRGEMMVRLQRAPTDAEIADFFSITPEEFRNRIINYKLRFFSLDKADDDDDGPDLREIIADPNHVNPEALVLDSELSRRLQSALGSIDDPRQLRVLELRYGMGPNGDGEKRVFREIGDELGVTAERIRVIHNQALENIKHFI